VHLIWKAARWESIAGGRGGFHSSPYWLGLLGYLPPAVPLPHQRLSASHRLTSRYLLLLRPVRQRLSLLRPVRQRLSLLRPVRQRLPLLRRARRHLPLLRPAHRRLPLLRPARRRRSRRLPHFLPFMTPTGSSWRSILAQVSRQSILPPEA
jgi:hypothetical protein